MSNVPAAFAWKTNGDLIADVAKLGYLEGKVLDPTYGEGVFWTKYTPWNLTASDLKGDGVVVLAHDFTNLPHPDGTFDVVVFDPPYKLNGTPSKGDERYGVDVKATWQERMQLCRVGATECARVLRVGGFLLWKCQDQVSSGAVRWQTIDFTHHAESLGLTLVDRFDRLGGRPQPGKRRQLHAHGRPSTLLVFQKKR